MKPERSERDTKAKLARIFFHLEHKARPADLPELLKKDGFEISREHASRLVWEAASKGRVRFIPDTEDLLGERLKGKFTQYWGKNAQSLNSVSVAPGSGSQNGSLGAELLLEIIETQWKLRPPSDGTIRVGFSGGITSAIILEELALRIKDQWGRAGTPESAYPSRLVFHAINGLLANGDPEFNPSRYFPSFTNGFPLKTEFVALPAPGVILESEWEAVKKLRAVAEALQYADQLDVVIGSGGHWGFGHKTVSDYVLNSCIAPCLQGTDKSQSLRSLWEEDVTNLAELRENQPKCVGDLFWQPIFSEATVKSPKRNIHLPSLFQLDDLPRMINQGTRVLVALGPCSGCPRPKGELIKAILKFPHPPLLTDLLVNNLNATAFLQLDREESNRHPSIDSAPADGIA